MGALLGPISNKTSSFSNIDRMNLFVMVKKKAFRLVFAAFVLNIVYAIKNGTKNLPDSGVFYILRHSCHYRIQYLLFTVKYTCNFDLVKVFGKKVTQCTSSK